MTELSRRDAFLLSAAALCSRRRWTRVRRGRGGAGPPTVWDLTDLYPSDAAWDAERVAVEKALPSLPAFKGKLGESVGQPEGRVDRHLGPQQAGQRG